VFKHFLFRVRFM